LHIHRFFDLKETTPSVVVVGVLDGVHRGHEALLAQAVQMAQAVQPAQSPIARAAEDTTAGMAPSGDQVPIAQVLVLTFERHPRAAIFGETVPMLVSPEERVSRILTACKDATDIPAARENAPDVLASSEAAPIAIEGCEDPPAVLTAHENGPTVQVRVLACEKDLFALTAQAFLEELYARVNLVGMVCGTSHTFGAERVTHASDAARTDEVTRVKPPSPVVAGTAQNTGNPQRLQAWAEARGLAFACVPPVTFGGEAISSSRIRRAVAQGQMAQVKAMLGQDFSYIGAVVPGEGIARQFGRPTINLVLDPERVQPQNGVYAGFAELKGRAYPAVINVGNGPTFGDARPRRMEAHLLQPAPEKLPPQMTLRFVEKIRDEQRFATPKDLFEQVARDVAVAERMLREASLWA